MNVSDIGGSKWLKCDDLKGRPQVVVIARVQMETVFDEDKLIIYLEGLTKHLVCNKTNMLAIAEFCGDETDDWPGAKIELYPTKVPFEGKRVDAIRVREPRDSIPAAKPGRRTPAAVANPDSDISDGDVFDDQGA